MAWKTNRHGWGIVHPCDWYEYSSIGLQEPMEAIDIITCYNFFTPC